MKNLKKFRLAPFLLITLGFIFLLNNFGILPWSVWTNLWKFWPLFLILVGIEILVGRSVSWKFLILLALVIFLTPVFFSIDPFSKNPLSTKELKLTQNIESLSKAKIVIELPAMNLRLGSLKSPSGRLLEGSLKYSNLAEKPTLSLDTAFGQGIYKINQNLISNNIPFISSLRNQLDLFLNTQIPLELLVKTGASQNSFDLRELKIDKLNIESQASTIFIQLSSAYSSSVRIKTTASTIEVKIPTGIEGRVKINSAVKSVSVPSGYKRDGDSYKSTGFDSASLKAEVSIEALAGSVTIK